MIRNQGKTRNKSSPCCALLKLSNFPAHPLLFHRLFFDLLFLMLQTIPLSLNIGTISHGDWRGMKPLEMKGKTFFYDFALIQLRLSVFLISIIPECPLLGGPTPLKVPTPLWAQFIHFVSPRWRKKYLLLVHIFTNRWCQNILLYQFNLN